MLTARLFSFDTMLVLFTVYWRFGDAGGALVPDMIPSLSLNVPLSLTAGAVRPHLLGGLVVIPETRVTEFVQKNKKYFETD